MTGASPPTGASADFLARLTKEQDERQNREARESFLEQQARLSINRPLKS
jgi:hypothetical protein